MEDIWSRFWPPLKNLGRSSTNSTPLGYPLRFAYLITQCRWNCLPICGRSYRVCGRAGWNDFAPSQDSRKYSPTSQWYVGADFFGSFCLASKEGIPGALVNPSKTPAALQRSCDRSALTCVTSARPGLPTPVYHASSYSHLQQPFGRKHFGFYRVSLLVMWSRMFHNTPSNVEEIAEDSETDLSAAFGWQVDSSGLGKNLQI